MNEYRIFTYEVSYYNSVDEIETCQGIAFARSYEEVMSKFKPYYGDGEITKVSIVEWYNESEDTLIELSKSTIQSMIEKGDLKQ